MEYQEQKKDDLTMIKKQIWLTSLVTMTMVLQLMAPVLAAQTAVGNERMELILRLSCLRSLILQVMAA